MWETDFFERSKTPPTADKHRALTAAFDDWLGRASGGGAPRTVFDGFAGAGRFADDTPGSPLLLLERALCWTCAGLLRFVFSESNALNFARLRESVAGSVSMGHEIELHHTTFERCAAEVVKTTEVGASKLFSFVDPYAYEGFQFATLAALAARGDLVLHFATEAICTKLRSSNGAGEAQARRMDAVLGGTPTWKALREQTADLPAEEAHALLAEVMRRALEGSAPDLRATLIPLRGGDSHLIWTRLAP